MRIPLILTAALLCGFALPAQVQGKTPPKPPAKQGQVGEKKQEVGKAGEKSTQGKTGEKAGKAGAGKGAEGKGAEGKGKVTQSGTKKKPDEVEEIPAGADPADLKAMKSAQDMLKAERRLAALLKSGKIKGIDKVLPFEEIASWPYEDALRGMPKALEKLGGKKVMMTGFMLPIDEVENIKEFLLVQSLWSCCYGQPPDINGTVRVIMQGKNRIDYKFDPIKVIGTFRISPTVEDGFCVDIYQLEAKSVEVIK